ncbi:hypothetical protein [Rhizobium sullae]|uniref:Uncharacterized protein n=1 Tax=Rhizobium sullae TaxID=50338 RepID=A0A4R3PRJ7_RHISU|nr:hypothetical protein [Rhizobium sullae]TCU02852.1 hypothetical protein EV132_15412 [Rhizobium sullae]UWU19364.1 hypothetical protein N2599_34680 [Rhizobium sullae]
MDLDSKRTRTAESSSLDGENAVPTHLSDLPVELVTNIAERLITADPRETARNLGLLKTVQAPQAVWTADGQETDLGKFYRRNNQLGRSANDLHNANLAEAGHGSDWVSTYQTAASGHIADFLPPETRTALVNRILDLDPINQAVAINLVATDLGKFDGEDKNRLVNRAIELLEAPNVYGAHESAHSAICNGYGHLDADQRARVGLILGANLQQQLEGIPRPERVAEPDLDRRITAIEASVRRHLDAPISFELVVGHALGTTGSISQVSDQARTDLVASFRSRERSDAGR